MRANRGNIMRYLYGDSKRGHDEGREKRFKVGSTNKRRKNKKATKKKTWEQSRAPLMEKSAKTDIANQQLTPDN
jgi:hypothetical protein